MRPPTYDSSRRGRSPITGPSQETSARRYSIDSTASSRTSRRSRGGRRASPSSGLRGRTSRSPSTIRRTRDSSWSSSPLSLTGTSRTDPGREAEGDALSRAATAPREDEHRRRRPDGGAECVAMRGRRRRFRFARWRRRMSPCRTRPPSCCWSRVASLGRDAGITLCVQHGMKEAARHVTCSWSARFQIRSRVPGRFA